jgi:YD repeat-containing protein
MGSAGSTSYGYNGDGLATSVVDAAGTTSYTYDNDDRLATLANPATGTTGTYSYNSDSLLKGISYGSGKDSQAFGYEASTGCEHLLTADGAVAVADGGTTPKVHDGWNGPHARRPPARVQDRLEFLQLRRGELALRPARAFRCQGFPAARGQRPPPPVRRHPRHPQPPGNLQVTGARLDHLRRFQPHFLPAGALCRGQPAAIGIPHPSGIPRDGSQHQTH